MATSTPQNYKVPSTSKISVDKLLRVGYYELEKTIGKGNFAVVKLASNIVTKSKVAIKIIDKTCLNEEYLAKTFREISILKSLRHPHITRLYEVMESQTMIYLVTEYAPNGEIFDYLVENGRMKEPEAARVFAQLVSAVRYCHEKGVVHRDLKAENVLLDKDMNIKLADFGFSNRYEEGNPLRTWCGSPPYAAPEVFQGFEYDGPKADIWSLGVVLYAMVCGALPFDGQTLLELKSRVVTGKFRIPYFMSQGCEHLIRNMLVVEPDRRYTLKHIMRHRWLSDWISELNCVGDFNSSCYQSSQASGNSLMRSNSNTMCCSAESVSNLDSVVMTHMLQLPGLTADMIAQSVHENRFDNIYAIYNLLYDKLQQKRREQQRLQHHANLAYSRSRKTSITTGVVDRSDPAKQESIDRLSPLTNTHVSTSNLGFQWTADVSVDLEKFGDFELECLALSNESQCNPNQLSANLSGTNGGNTRRHTVGPGDVAHEQALVNPNVQPIDFKCTTEQKDAVGPYLPMNLPLLQNQPLHNLTTKDQHLLKPPTVMGASSFGRRASDGGANLHIYYPSSMNNMSQTAAQVHHQIDAGSYYINPNHANVNMTLGSEMVSGLPSPISEQQIMVLSTENSGEEGNEDIQRYMQLRGCGKRHTVGCTDDISQQSNSAGVGVTTGGGTNTGAVLGGGVGVGSGGCNRTRRTGLLTVTERPPVISPELIREVETRMNRNYLPPALKMQQNNNLSQSPPTGTFGASLPSNSSTSNISPTSTLATSSMPLAPPATNPANCRRTYGRACKLPTVQEVGRYSPVRRASEGSKTQFQGPLQECQYLQKGIAQRNFLVAPSPTLLENSISLPGSPIHGKPNPNAMLRRGQDIEVPHEALRSLLPALEHLINEQCISVEVGKKIITSGIVPLELAPHLGLSAHSGNAISGGHLDTSYLHQQHFYSSSVSPLSLPNNGNTDAKSGSVNIAMGGNPLMSPHFANNMGLHSKQLLGQQNYFSQQYSGTGIVGQLSNINLNKINSPMTGILGIGNSNSSSGCQSPVYSSFSGSSSPNPYIPSSGPFNVSAAGGSSPLHQITKGISVLTTGCSSGGGGGSITRGTSAASEIALASSSTNQPLDLSMDVCNLESNGDRISASYAQQQASSHSSQNWFTPQPSFYDLKPLNLSPAQPVRVVSTPPASPNLCIIQEENANGQMFHTITTGTPHAGCSGGLIEHLNSPCQPSHPQISLTDVQGSEITLVALSSENSHDSDCDSLEHHTPLMSLQGLIITEPSSDMPSITRGIGRKTSLENDNNSNKQESDTIICSTVTSDANADANRRGSDKSLGFSDDSLSNDSNNLSPCQEPSASSGFKSDSHSEIGDHTEGHLTPDSICDSRRMSDEMCYEVPLPHECSNLDPSLILEMVKQTIDQTMPPKGFILHKAIPEENVCSDTPRNSSASSETSSVSMDTSSGQSIMNLSLEYSGGLQIELQICEGRSRDNLGAGKGIKLRRISGDQFEYGKLCQQLISTLTMQQVAG